MRIAVINNGATAPSDLLAALPNGSWENFSYEQCEAVQEKDFNIIILSGSKQFPVEGNDEKLRSETQLVLNSTIPIMGICFGCEVIVAAFGGTLKDRGAGTQERATIGIDVVSDDVIFGGKKHFIGYDAHRWITDTIPEHFVVLATSIHGPEIIRHNDRPIYGVQFHPEKHRVSSDGGSILDNFMAHYSTT